MDRREDKEDRRKMDRREDRRKYKLKLIRFIQTCINCNKAFWSTNNLFTKPLADLIKVATGFTPEYREKIRLQIKIKKHRSLNMKNVASVKKSSFNGDKNARIII